MDLDDGEGAGAEAPTGNEPGLGLGAGLLIAAEAEGCDAAPSVDCGVPPQLVVEGEPVAVVLPSGLVVEFTAAGDGIRIVLHGAAGPTEVAFDGFVSEAVVVEEPVVVTEPVVAIDPAPEVAPAVEPEAVGTPSPVPGSLRMQDGISVYEVGPPQVDTDGNGWADAVVIEEQGLRTVAIDRNGDGWVDRVEVSDLASGAVGVFERQADGSWSPVGTPGDPSAQAPLETSGHEVFVVPPEVALEPLGPEAPATAQALRHMELTMLGFVVDFFPAAFPGEPWPTDESGRPYPAEVLLRMMAAPENENRDVQRAAERVLTDLEKARSRVFR